MSIVISDFSENIIVGVVYNSVYNWYVTDKEIWFLDYKKRIKIFEEKGFEIKEEYIDESRQNLLILDSQNISVFLEKISEHKISTNELRKLLIKSREAGDDSWMYQFRPSLYVNFDNHKLYSLYSEPASYEDYVPINWEGSYFDFLELVPITCKYWISEDSVNLLKR